MKGFRWCPQCGAPHPLDTRACPETGAVLATSDAQDPTTRSTGRIIDGKYRIRRRLGKGPAGVVYEAEHIAHGWVVALKIVRPGANGEPLETRLRRTRNNARVLSAVGHPNICLIHDLGELPDGMMYIVSDRLRGTPLKIGSAGLPQEEARNILVQLLSALQAAHEAGIVHGNLKPDNVFLAKRTACPSAIRVMDFGGDGHATPRYVAPETLAGLIPDRRSDLWACGVILYRMLTGQRPFAERTIPELRAAIEARRPPPPSELRPELAGHWDSVIRRALEKDRTRRFADALEFVDAIPRPKVLQEEREILPSLISVPPPSYVTDALPDSVRKPPSSRQAVSIRPSMLPSDLAATRLIAGKYKLESLLGTGNAGAVYRATHQDLGRKVAVKLLHSHNRTEAQFVRRFKAEARVVSQLDHANVTRILDFGEEADGLLYLVMEYVAGQSLETLIASAGKLSPARVVNIGIQVCGALKAAHDLGIIHRDIKPENILLVAGTPGDSEGNDLVKVCDFGAAKLKVTLEDAEVTGAMMLCGSPAYMSPEQARCEELDGRSDIYSLGVALYEALVGELPIAATDLTEQLTRVQSELPRSPSSLLPDVDPLLEDVLLRMLEKDPAKRHQTAREVRTELQELASQLGLESGSSVLVVTQSKYPSS